MVDILEKDPYYEVGTINDIVVSNSSLKEIDPKRGGSPRKFKLFFEERKDTQTKAMLRGSVFHLYCEKPKEFVVSQAVKPSDKLGLVADALIAKYEALEDNQSKDEFKMMIDSQVVQACRAVGWNNNWKDEAIAKNSAPVVVYFHAVYDPANEGKIILTQQLKDQIEGCVQSLSNNEYAHRLLFWQNDFANIQYWKELDIYWTEVIDGVEIKCKGKLDDLVIDHEKKVVKINDVKTSGGSAYQFEGSFVSYRLDFQFEMYRRAVIAYCIANNINILGYKFQYRNIVVETAGLFQTVVHRWSTDIIGDCGHELDNLFRRVIHARTFGYTQSLEEYKGKGEVQHKELEKK